MRPILLLLLLWTLPLNSPALNSGESSPHFAVQEGEYARVRDRAEALVGEGSFEAARREYAALDLQGLAPDEQRWVAFRLADLDWRAAPTDADRSRIDAARERLLELAPEDAPSEERDRVWAEVQASLGDLLWARRPTWNASAAYAHYERALDWYGRSSDLELAASRWLAIFWNMARPEWAPGAFFTDRGRGAMPERLVEQAIGLARDEEQRAQARFALAQLLLQRANEPRVEARAFELLEGLAADGREQTVHDDALWALAERLERVGRWVRDDDGRWEREPDLAAALERYRELTRIYTRRTSGVWERARQRADSIVEPQVQVWTPGAFLPGSELGFGIAWRNADRARITLRRLALDRDVAPGDADERASAWLDQLSPSRLPVVAEWSLELDRAYALETRMERIQLDAPLPRGAYLLQASIDGDEARALLLSTDAAVVLAGVGRDLTAWVVNATTGEPLPGARVVTQARVLDGDWVWRRFEGVTDADGLARFDLGALRRADLRVVARAGDDQALAVRWANDPGERERFKALVATDRPAYRPGQTVSYSMVMRSFEGESWRAPVDGLEAVVLGPRGDVVFESPLELSDFGTAHGALETGGSWTLGSYTLVLRRGDVDLARTSLFQLEEYRLPEFRVSVEPPRDERGQPETFVLGDALGASVTAETYAGAPVAGAEVEVVVRRRPWSFDLEPHRPHPWFEVADDRGYWEGWYGGDEEVERRQLVTDAEGRVELELETSAFDDNGWEYTLEARVTDALRREVTGSGTLRVAAQSFGALVELERRVVAPGAPLEATLRLEDANGGGVVASGSLSLVRLTELTDAAFEARYGPGVLPGPDAPREVEEELARVPITTDPDGEARWLPRVPSAGAYLVRYEALDARSRSRVSAEARAFAADDATDGLGIRSDGLALVLDSERAGEGDEAAAILLADRSGRSVLFTSASNGRVDVQVVRLRGLAKLVAVPLEARHVPSVRLRARAVDGGRLLADEASLTVAPVRRALEVGTTLDADVYAPGEPARVDLVVTDHLGNPVQAELSLTLFDEAVTSIAAESTPDPRRWFYERGLPYTETTGSSLDGQRHDVFGWDERLGLLAPTEQLERLVQDSSVDFRGMGKSLEALGYLSSEGGPALMAAAPASRSLGLAGDLFDAERAEADFAAPMRQGLDGPDPGHAQSANIRTDFRETAFWAPALRTDEAGRAQVTFDWPDSTTRWRLTGVANDGGGRFGIEQREAARTTLPLLLRLATPRFLVDGDEALFTTMVRNDTEEPVAARVALALEGAELVGLVGAADAVLELAPGAEGTLDWRVRADGAGELRVVASVTAGEASDGVERTLPVLEHGLEVLVAAAGALEGERSVLGLDLPPARPGSTTVEVTVTPSLAATAIEALPYLADYPYGCLEQTLSRFVPTVVTLDALERLGFERGAVANAAFDRPTTLRPRADAERTLEQIDRMAAEGLERVLSMQASDGGFSWWPGGSADVFMSGYAVWALALAREAGLDVPNGALERGQRFLTEVLTETVERDPELGAWCLHAITAAAGALGRPLDDASTVEARFELAYANRGALGAYGRALLLIAAQRLGREAEVEVLLRNVLDGVHLEDGPGGGVLQPDASTTGRRTARWGEDGLGRRWSEDGVEATAFSLRALLAVDPDHELVEPAIEWLVLERRGSAWKSTRDTAICVLSLVDAVVTRGELDREGEFVLRVDGQERGVGVVPKGIDALVPARWPLGDLGAGEHELTLERVSGSGRLYWNVVARTFSVEDRIRPRANELAVRRDVQRLVGRDTLLAGKLFERVPLRDGDRVTSGERFEVVVVLETRAALEYLALEDFKPAGFEATDVTSGGGARLRQLRDDEVERRYGQGLVALETVGDAPPSTGDGYTGQSRWAYRELRDTRVLHFVDRLPPGVWEVRTTLRAETPGTFAALPARAHAMYAPDLAGNSWELSVTIDG